MAYTKILGSSKESNEESANQDEALSSKDLSGIVPAAAPVEPFIPQEYVKDSLIYDPSYIHKFKGPTMGDMIGALNRLSAAVTDLQSVVVNLVEEQKETRKVLEDIVWNYTKQCCDEAGISYSSVGNLWDGSGVVEEGIAPYINALEIK